MYQPEEAQPPMELLAHLGKEDNLALPAETTAEKPAWFSELPYFWSKAQVLEWISYHVEKNKYDASAINFSCCNMDGYTLCHCTPEQLRLVFGPLGDESKLACPQSLLPYNPGQGPFLSRDSVSVSDELTWIIDLLEKEDMSSQEIFQDSSASELGNSYTKESLEEMKSTNPFFQADFSYISGALSPGSSDISVSGTGMSHSPNSQDSGGSDIDPDPTEVKLFSSDAPRGTHLWEFIRDILLHPELNEGLMKWEDRSEGVFKFLRSEAVAQLWGQKKKNSSMTYEKLSRAMRYYYKREILERVDGRRLVYKFGKNSSGWKEEEVLSRNGITVTLAVLKAWKNGRDVLRSSQSNSGDFKCPSRAGGPGYCCSQPRSGKWDAPVCQLQGHWPPRAIDGMKRTGTERCVFAKHALSALPAVGLLPAMRAVRWHE
ncbi:ETS-related transcription factor Elf-3 [Chelonia mydas]|uniref:ETS-related transcription factor Elf-3 n=1 Tax=Chelonia mydas TaxID=8469 RepID=M7C8S3_CHEMY|nr:ETS-related transcription factor Elf-3 [Chelonia mydas]